VQNMKPQDLLVLAKLSVLKEQSTWKQTELAMALFMSQSEISESLARSRKARLLNYKGKDVDRRSFLKFLEHGLPYVFPVEPGAVVRGTVTAHSALPLANEIKSDEPYVWPYAKGKTRGHGIQPLYPSVLQAVEQDAALYKLLALMDTLRVGRAREKKLALSFLKRWLC